MPLPRCAIGRALRAPSCGRPSLRSGAGVILGEGKPENQNSAIPYCTGNLLQTIDMK